MIPFIATMGKDPDIQIYLPEISAHKKQDVLDICA